MRFLKNEESHNEMIQLIDCHAIAREAHGSYRNRVLTTANDHNVTTELFYWKTQPDSDETFLVLEDTLIIDLEDGPVELNSGRLPIVPAGVGHRTGPSGARSVNLTVEKAGTSIVRCYDNR